jgi:endonuclease/exonuclease/phosphatase family metal-dependent hydrolase
MEERSQLLLERVADYDVICLNEAFQFGSNIVGNFVKKANVLGFKYVVSGPKVPVFTRKVLDSGVLVLSKYPIIKSNGVVYHQGCGVDSFAAKSGVYAEIAVSSDQRVHVFATHLQASYEVVTEVDYGVRDSQTRELRALIEESVGVPAAPVFLLGDMNINSIGEKGEYLNMTENLSITGYELIDTLKCKDHPVTSVGSIDRNPEPDEQNLTCAWENPESIDYVFLYLPETTQSCYATEVQEFQVTDKPYCRLSDHLGLECTFRFL